MWTVDPHHSGTARRKASDTECVHICIIKESEDSVGGDRRSKMSVCAACVCAGAKA